MCVVDRSTRWRRRRRRRAALPSGLCIVVEVIQGSLAAQPELMRRVADQKEELETKMEVGPHTFL